MPEFTVSIRVQAVDETSAATEAARRAMQGLGESTTRTQSALDSFGTGATRNLEKVEEAAEDAGDEIKEIGPKAKQAEAQAKGPLDGIKNALGDVVKIAAGFTLANLGQQLGRGLADQLKDSVKAAEAFQGQVRGIQMMTGATAEDVSGIVAAFERFGLSSQQASTSLGIFSKQMAKMPLDADEVVTGLDDAGKELKGFGAAMADLGVHYTDTEGNQRGMIDVLMDTADAFKEMGQSTDATATAMTLFGRSGRAMLPLLMQGSEGIQAVADQARRMGLTLTTENMAAIREYSMAQKDMNQALQGLKLQIGVALMPVLSAFAKLAAELAVMLNTSLMPVVKALGEFLGSNLGPTLRGIFESFTSVLGVVARLVGPLMENEFVVSLLGGALKILAYVLIGVGAGMLAFEIYTKAAAVATGIYNAVVTAAAIAKQAYAVWIAISTGATTLETLAEGGNTIAKTLNTIITKGQTIATGIQTAATWALTAAQWALNAALAFALSPVGLIVIAIVALAAAFLLAYRYIEPFRNLVDSTWARIKEFWGGLKDLWGALVEAFTGDAGAMGVVYDLIRKLFGDTIAEFFQPFLQFVMEAIPKVKQLFADLTDMWNALVEAFTGDVGALGVVYDLIKKIFGEGAAEALQPFLQILMEAIPIVREFFGAIGEAFSKLRAGDFSGFLSDIGAAFFGLFEGMLPLVSRFGEALRVLVLNAGIVIFDALREMFPQFAGVFDVLQNIFAVGVNFMMRTFAILIDMFDALLRGDWGRLWEGAKNIVKEWISAVLATFEILGRALLDLLAPVGEWLQEKLVQPVQSKLGQVKTFFQELPAAIIGAIMAMVGQVTVRVQMLIAIFDEVRNRIAEALSPQNLAYVAGFLIGWVIGMVPRILNALGEWKDAFIDWVQSLPGAIWDGLTTLWDRFSSWFMETAINIAVQLMTWWSTFETWAKALPDAIWDGLTDLWNRFASWFMETAASIGEHLMDWANRFGEWAASLPGAIWDGLIDLWNQFSAWIAETARNIADRLVEWKDAFITWVQETAQALPGALMAFLQGIKDWVSETSTEVASAGAEVGKNLIQGIRDFVVNNAKALGRFVTDTIKSGMGALGGLIERFGAGMTAGQEAAGGMGDAMMAGVAAGVIDSSGQPIAASADVAQDMVDAFNRQLEIASPSMVMAESGAAVVEGLMVGIASNTASAVAAMAQTGAAMIEGLVVGINATVTMAIGAMNDVCAAVIESARAYLGVGSPSTVMREIGVDTIAGLVDGMAAVAAQLDAWMKGNVVDVLVNAIKGYLGIGSPSTVMRTLGVDTLAGLVEGMKAIADQLGGWIKDNVTDAIPNFIKQFLGISSPSSVMRSIGENIMEGFVEGLKNKLPEIQSFMSRLGGLMGGGVSGPAATSGAMGEIADYIRQAAAQRGIDPEVAIRVAMSEGGVTNYNERGTFATGSCYDGETRVLTRRGFIYFRDATMDDEFATRRADGVIEYQRPERLIRQPYSGPMYRVKNRNVDLLITPNHKMLAYRQNRTVYQRRALKEDRRARAESLPRGHQSEPELEFIEIQELVKTRHWRIPAHAMWLGEDNTWVDRVVDIPDEDWAAFAGLYLSEGNQQPGWAQGMVITQKDGPRMTAVERVIGATGIPTRPYRWAGRPDLVRFNVDSSWLGLWAEPLGKSGEKYIPRDLLNADPRVLLALLTGLWLGDGAAARGRYGTNSKQLAEDVAELAIKLGFAASILIEARTGRSRKDGKPYNPIYIVSVRPGTDFELDVARHVSVIENWEGEVFCTTVPNHTLLIERSGKLTWCSQSWWPFQLHYGGAGYEHLGTTAGMGNTFTQQTGFQPGDPAAWKASVDYALNHAAQNGWGAWYGAAKVGVGNMTGIGGARQLDQGGWLTEPVVGVGPSGTRYQMHANEFVAPAGPRATAAAAGVGGGGGITLNVAAGAVQISGTSSAREDIASAADLLWDDLYAKLSRAMSNRAHGVGVMP